MESVDLYGVIIVVSTLCSITAFFIGQSRAIKKDAAEEEIRQSDQEKCIHGLSLTLKEVRISLNKLELKIDRNNEDYQEIFKLSVETHQAYKSLHKRVDRIENEIRDLRKEK